MDLTVPTLVVVTTIWVGLDASAYKITTSDKPYSASNGALTWVIGCILLWVIVLPWYLVRRSKTLRSGSATAGTKFITAIPQATPAPMTEPPPIREPPLIAEIQKADVPNTSVTNVSMANASIAKRGSLAAEFERLGKLCQDGLLSEDEFVAAKRKLFG